MASFKSSNIISLSLILLSGMTSYLPCLAAETAMTGSAHYTVTTTDDKFSLLPKVKIKPSPKVAEIYEYDDLPLAGRQPLLLVHGLIGEFHPLFRWREMAEFLKKNADFDRRFKIYMVRYNTFATLDAMTQDLKGAILKVAPQGNLTIVSISLSGCVIRNAMRDERVNKTVNKVITMGAFFRGSPLFVNEWMQKSIKKRHISPFYRADRLLAYKIYFNIHKELTTEFCWDNVDGEMPADVLAKVQARTHSITPSGNLRQMSSELPGDHKFIVYAGYLNNQYVPQRQSTLKKTVLLPFKFLDTTLPMHFALEHPALRYINNMIADTVPGKGDPSRVIYPLNDGIAPVSSSLLLTDEFVSHADLSFCDKESMRSYGTHTYAKKARLFEDIDHLTYIEAKRPSGSSQEVTDVLSEEKPRPIFDWIVHDVLN